MAQNLNQLSDDDLLKMASQHGVTVPKSSGKADGLEAMSDEDLIRLADLHGVPVERSPSEIPEMAAGFAGRGVGGLIGKGISKIGEWNEKYLAGPTRAGISAAMDEITPEALISPAARGKVSLGLVKGFANQFGKEPSEGISPTDLRRRFISDKTLGDKSLSDVPYVKNLYTESGEGLPLQKGGLLDPSAQGSADFAVDMLADVGNLIPFEKVITPFVKPVFKGAQAGVEAAKGLMKGVGEKAISAEAKIANAATGVPEHVVRNYIENGKSVDDLIAKYGANDVAASDAIREQYQTQLRNFKNEANDMIEKGLKNRELEITNIKPVIESLKKSKLALNAETKVAERATLQEYIDTLTKLSDENGDAFLGNVHAAQEFLKEKATGSYLKSGQIFLPGTDVSRAAKEAARKNRLILNKAAPDIAEANNKLSFLHAAEEGLNKNLIKPGGPQQALLTAGAQPMSRQRAQLDRLSKITGVPMAQKAEDLATAKMFASPDLLPIDTTGKSASRLAMGGLLGTMAASGNPMGAALGAMLTSPMALKYGIKTQRGLIKAAEKVGTQLGKPVDWVLTHPKEFSSGLEKGLRKSSNGESSKK